VDSGLIKLEALLVNFARLAAIAGREKSNAELRGQQVHLDKTINETTPGNTKYRY
jgi:hypothetical protein